MDTHKDHPIAALGALPLESEPLPTAQPSREVLQFLARRRSLLVKDIGEPGPTEEDVDALLRVAVRVPDHGKLAPWRFIIIQGAARARLGAVLEGAFVKRQPDASPTTIALERARLERAPVVVAVVAAPVPSSKIPEWEQVLSAGAVCHQLLLAANAAGFAAQWLTEWYAYDREVLGALGLVGGERMAGFVYIGSATREAEERRRPDVSALTTRL